MDIVQESIKQDHRISALSTNLDHIVQSSKPSTYKSQPDHIECTHKWVTVERRTQSKNIVNYGSVICMLCRKTYTITEHVKPPSASRLAPIKVSSPMLFDGDIQELFEHLSIPVSSQDQRTFYINTNSSDRKQELILPFTRNRTIIRRGSFNDRHDKLPKAKVLPTIPEKRQFRRGSLPVFHERTKRLMDEMEYISKTEPTVDKLTSIMRISAELIENLEYDRQAQDFNYA